MSCNVLKVLMDMRERMGGEWDWIEQYTLKRKTTQILPLTPRLGNAIHKGIERDSPAFEISHVLFELVYHFLGRGGGRFIGTYGCHHGVTMHICVDNAEVHVAPHENVRIVTSHPDCREGLRHRCNVVDMACCHQLVLGRRARVGKSHHLNVQPLKDLANFVFDALLMLA